MEIINFSNLESQVLDSFNQGNRSFEALIESCAISEKSLHTVIEALLSKNIFQFNTKTREYEYQTKVEGEVVILDGNVILPTTIIKLNDRILVTRGQWYEFPIDFDVRRIVWNVKLESKTNSTLVDFIRTAILKEKKSRIVQLPEYANLVNKIVPYSPNINLLINCVGESVTDIYIVFKIKLSIDSDISVEFKNFMVRSEISTESLITEIKKPVAERNYQQNIKLNQIFNFSDFIFAKNEIPISIVNNTLTYLKITGIKKSFEFTYYKMDSVGNSTKFDVESFDDSTEAVEKLRDIFKGLPCAITSQNNFLIELTE